MVAPVSQGRLLEEGHRVRLIRCIKDVKANILDYSHQSQRSSGVVIHTHEQQV